LGDKRFPSAAKLYDDPIHTFHQKGTPGAACVSCHMPAKKYMIIHSRPDHSIRIPRPDLSMKLGTPNACTQCHTHKTANWANDWIIKWYGAKPTKIHYGEIIAAGRTGEAGAEAALINLAGDTSEPNVVRATALDLLSHYGPASLTASIESLHNTDPIMRHAALTGLEKLGFLERLSQVAPFLLDPIRAVRIEAARILSSVPLNLFNADQRANFDSALREFISAEKQAADMPGSNLNLGVIHENLGQIDQAESYYLHALSIDPGFTPARLNLARLYNSMHRNADAERILREGISRDAQQGELYYSLGLLLAEDKRLSEAVPLLSEASQLLPNNARVQYNYALVLQQLGKREEAEQALLSAERLDSTNSTVIYALAVFYSQDAVWSQAEKWANKLAELNPQNAQVQQFVTQIRMHAAENY
jgi:tetratricopeptide (TPR) repeat protein